MPEILDYTVILYLHERGGPKARLWGRTLTKKGKDWWIMLGTALHAKTPDELMPKVEATWPGIPTKHKEYITAPGWVPFDPYGMNDD